MKFSKDFLNKLLNSAIYFYNTEKKGTKIPLKLKSVDYAIDYFTNALEFEANKALQREIIVDSPLLHAVNLNTNNPGIISDKKDKKLVVHRKKKIIKPKTEEQIIKRFAAERYNETIDLYRFENGKVILKSGTIDLSLNGSLNEL